MSENTTNFMDYTGGTHTNLMISLVNFRQELDVFYNVDEIFHALLRDKCTEKYIQEKLLCHLAHEQFYFSIKTLFQGCIINSYPSVRLAIDASLTAYILSSEPQDDDEKVKYIDAYLSGRTIIEKPKDSLDQKEQELLAIYKRRFENPKRYIKDVLKNTPESFSLATYLIGQYEFYSSNAHPEFNSFAYRIKLNEQGLPTEYSYFSIPEDKRWFQIMILSVLQDFIKIIRIFAFSLGKNYDPRLKELGDIIEKIGVPVVQDTKVPEPTE